MRIVENYLPFLTGEERNYIKEPADSWEKRCMGHIVRSLPILVNSLYVQKYFDLELRHLVYEIIEGIKKEFKKNLMINTWMDKITKHMAIFKLESMGALIGFPEELLDDTILKKHFENLTIGESFFESTLAITSFNYYQKFYNLREDINKTDWRLHSSIIDINAFYLPHMNLISEFQLKIIKNYTNKIFFFRNSRTIFTRRFYSSWTSKIFEYCNVRIYCWT